jgi:hypothetical protein
VAAGWEGHRYNEIVKGVIGVNLVADDGAFAALDDDADAGLVD